MINREKVIINYVDGYNQFDTDKMVLNFDNNIVFENVQNGEINLSIVGLGAFMKQAELAKTYFATRIQTIKSFKHSKSHTEIEIDYFAVLSVDLPNGKSKGEALRLSGKSIFYFNKEQIVKLVDIS